eukprot:TRINITY_DN12251_c0_g1_i1.p1 TRINITY_DN12251_c0_g1~~TRINITY_DN12251_c0_g1_i1.p1  ORF type:complete len:2948 (+),score=773.97 TRINITY_DN12251_c0_g1_i1:1110-8846(+)
MDVKFGDSSLFSTYCVWVCGKLLHYINISNEIPVEIVMYLKEEISSPDMQSYLKLLIPKEILSSIETDLKSLEILSLKQLSPKELFQHIKNILAKLFIPQPTVDKHDIEIAKSILEHFDQYPSLPEANLDDLKAFFYEIFDSYNVYLTDKLKLAIGNGWQIEDDSDVFVELVQLVLDFINRHFLRLSIPESRNMKGIQFCVDCLTKILSLTNTQLQSILQQNWDTKPGSSYTEQNLFSLLSFLQSSFVGNILPLLCLCITLAKEPEPVPELKKVIADSFKIEQLFTLLESCDYILHLCDQSKKAKSSDASGWLLDVCDIFSMSAGYVAICLVTYDNQQTEDSKFEMYLDCPVIRKGLRTNTAFEGRMGNLLSSIINREGDGGQLLSWIQKRSNVKAFFPQHPKFKLAENVASTLMACLITCNNYEEITQEYISKIKVNPNTHRAKWLIELWEKIQSLLSNVIKNRQIQVASGASVSYEDLFDAIITRAKFLMRFQPEKIPALNNEKKNILKNSWDGDDGDDAKKILNSDATKSVLKLVQDESFNCFEQIISCIDKRNTKCSLRATGFDAFTRILTNLKCTSPKITVLTPLRWMFMTSWDSISHHDIGLAAASLTQRKLASTAWRNLYKLLSGMLTTDNLELTMAIINAWNIQIRKDDIKFLTDIKVLHVLRGIINKLEPENAARIHKEGEEYLFTTNKPSTITKKVYLGSVILMQLLTTQMVKVALANEFDLDISIIEMLTSEIVRSANIQNSPSKLISENVDCKLLIDKRLFSSSQRLCIKQLLPTKNSFSVSLWISLKRGSSPMNIVRWQNAEGTTLNLVLAVDGHFNFIINFMGKEEKLTSSGAISENTWIHLTFVLNGEQFIFYFDGNLENTISLGGMTLNTEGAFVKIGAKGKEDGFNGTLSDLRFFNRPLKESEIQLLHNSQKHLEDSSHEYTYQLLCLLHSFGSSIYTKQFFKDNAFVTRLLEIFDVGTFRVKELCLMILRKMLDGKLDESLVGTEITLFNFLSNLIEGVLNDQNSIDGSLLITKIVSLLRLMCKQYELLKTNINNLVMTSFKNFLESKNHSTLAKSVASSYIFGGVEQNDTSVKSMDGQSFDTSICIDVPLYLSLIERFFSEDLSTDKCNPLLISHLQTRLLRSYCTFIQEQNSPVVVRLLNQNDDKTSQAFLTKVLEFVPKLVPGEVSARMEIDTFSAWSQFYQGLRWAETDPVPVPTETKNAELEELKVVFPLEAVDYLERVLKQSGNVVEKASAVVLEDQAQRKIKYLKEILGDYPTDWLKTAFTNGGEDLDKAVVWFKDNFESLLDMEKIQKEQENKENKFTEIFSTILVDEEAKSDKKDKPVGSLENLESSLKIYYSRQILLALLYVAPKESQQFLLKKIQPQFVKICQLLSFRKVELNVLGKTAKDILNDVFLELLDNEKVIDEVTKLCMFSSYKLGTVTDYVLSDIVEGASSDLNALEVPNISMLDWLFRNVIFKKTIPFSTLDDVYRALVYALNHPHIQIKQVVFELLSESIRQLDPQTFTKLKARIPLDKIENLSLNRLQKESLEGISHIYTPYLYSILNFVGLYSSFKEANTQNLSEMKEYLSSSLICWVSSKTPLSVTISWYPGDASQSTVLELRPSLKAIDVINPFAAEKFSPDIVGNVDAYFQAKALIAEKLKQATDTKTTPPETDSNKEQAKEELDEDWTIVYTGTDSQYVVSNLTPGTEYQFRIRRTVDQKNLYSAIQFTQTDGVIEDLKAPTWENTKNSQLQLSEDSRMIALSSNPSHWCMAMGDLYFTNGVHYWEMEIVECPMVAGNTRRAGGSGNLWIGIVTLEDFKMDTLCGVGILNDRAAQDRRDKTYAIYGERFGQGDKIGVLLNLEKGTMEYFLNGSSMGVVFPINMNYVGQVWSPCIGMVKSGTKVRFTTQSLHLATPSSEFYEYAFGEIYSVLKSYLKKTDLPVSFVNEAYTHWINWVNARTMTCTTKGGIVIPLNEDPLFPKGTAVTFGDSATKGTVVGKYGDTLWIIPSGSSTAVSCTPNNVTVVEKVSFSELKAPSQFEFLQFIEKALHPQWNYEQDCNLVSKLNSLIRKFGKKISDIPLKVISNEFSVDNLKSSDSSSIDFHPILQEKITERISVLIIINQYLENVLSLLDFRNKQEGNLVDYIRQIKGIVFMDIKSHVFGKWMNIVKDHFVKVSEDEYELPPSMVHFKVDRQSANEARKEDDTIFLQAYQIFRKFASKELRRLRMVFIGKLDKGQKRSFVVDFKGENVYDNGGPYREFFVNMVQELQSDKISLFIKTPNNEEGIGENQSSYKINTSRSSTEDLKLYQFIGILMAIALRTDVTMPFTLPSMFWKYMTSEKPDRYDLEEINYRQISYLAALENDSEKEFGEREGMKWVFISGRNQQQIELIPDGKNVNVCWAKRKEYVEKVIQMQLNEDIPQMEAIKTGFGSIIPADYLSLFSGSELEALICGEPEIDIAQLKENAIYEDVSPFEPHIQFFWRAMEELKPEQHEKFMQFTWARPRMPISGNTHSLTIQGPPPASHDNPNLWLPTARSCFFSISIPRYTDYEVAKGKLIWAIEHCKEMNADFRG